MTIFYTLDGNIEREMNKEEIQNYLNYQQEVEQQKQNELKTLAAKLAKRQAALDKLGLTADEAAALFG